jgi:hypothetical protein
LQTKQQHIEQAVPVHPPRTARGTVVREDAKSLVIGWLKVAEQIPRPECGARVGWILPKFACHLTAGLGI